ncbi:MAG: hypothetical protein WA708_15870 [Acidobacteriaceae bacterium]
MYAIRGRYLAICSAVLFFPALALAQQTLVRTQAFASGQSVRFEANVGDIHIVPNSDDRQLRLVIVPKHGISLQTMQSWVRQFQVNGNVAEIRLHLPIHGNEVRDVTLYVPSVTALDLDIGVGDVSVNGVGGDKDVTMHVGDLKIGGLNRADYGIVKLDTGIGDVEDSLFPAQQSGWLGKSGKFVGSGKYHIRVHVGIGDIRVAGGVGR